MKYAQLVSITSHLFEAFLKCPMKCHLRSLGEPDSSNTYAEWGQGQNESYQSKAIRRLRKDGEWVVAPPATGNFTSAKWHLAVHVVAQANFEPISCKTVDSY